MAGQADQEGQLVSGAPIGAEISDSETNDSGDRRRVFGLGQSFEEGPEKVGVSEVSDGSFDLPRKEQTTSFTIAWPITFKGR